MRERARRRARAPSLPRSLSLLSSVTLEEEIVPAALLILLPCFLSLLSPSLPKLKIIELTEYRLNGLSAKRVGPREGGSGESGEVRGGRGTGNEEVCTLIGTGTECGRSFGLASSVI